MQNSCVRETSGLHESNVPYRLFVVPALIPLSSLCSGVSAFPVPVLPPFCFLGRTSFFCPMRFVSLTCVPCFPFACSLSRCTCLSYSRAFYSLSFCRTPFLRLRAFRFTCAPSLFFLRVPLFRRVLPSCSFPLYLLTAFFSSSFFISVLSFPFSPLLSSPSFSI
mgnify:CR=1 FL=1